MQVVIRGAPANVEVIGDGRPIVFLHGLPADHRLMIRNFEPAFTGRPGWRRVYPDLPGMGRTSAPDWIINQQGMLDWTLGLVDAVLQRDEPYVLAGASYGAYLALRVLERQPERIRGLLLQAPVVRLDPSSRTLPERRVLVEAGPELKAELTEIEAAWLDVSVVQTHRTLEGFRQGIKLGIESADHGFLDRLDSGSTADEVRRPITPFPRPTLILTGRQDHLTGYADALDVLESFPRATLAILDRAGHALAVEQPALFGALVGEWLDRLDAEAARSRAS